MQNLTNIINSVLRDILPQHLVRIITPKLVRAIERERGDCGDEEGVKSVVLPE